MAALGSPWRLTVWETDRKVSNYILVLLTLRGNTPAKKDSL